MHRFPSWRPILDSFDIDVALFDTEGRYVYVNPQAVRDPAIRQAVMGMTDLEYVAFRGLAPELGRRRFEAVKDVLASGEIHRFEETLVTTAGETRQFVRRLCPMRDESGVITGVLGFGYDVTDFRSARAELAAKQEALEASMRQAEAMAARFDLVARATNDVVWDWDLITGKLWWNGAMQSVFGHTIAALGDAIEGWTDNLHPDDLDRVVHGIRVAIDGTAQTWEDTYRFRRADGTYALVLDRGYILRDETGHAVRMIGSMQDITRRQELEDQLRHAQKMEAVGQLAAGVAHDFNNILTAISAYAELLLRDFPTGSPHRDDIEEIQHAALRATALTRQLLSFSRKEIVRPTVLDLNDVVRENLLLLRRAAGEDVRVVLDLDTAECRVRADRHQLGQVLMNLTINARDAMRARGGTLTIATGCIAAQSLGMRAPQETKARLFAHLRVRDTGAGMDAETLSRIFEPFFTTKDVGEGTGLGLATVYGIVRQADGAVWAESIPGEGSAFHVVLPIADGPPDESARSDTPPHGHPRAGTVLLVEDEPAVRESVTRGLQRKGYEVIQSGDATEAMRIWDERGGVDVVVTDVVMPGLRGPDMIKLLRRERPDLPVIFISGYPANALDAEELALPRTAFLVKPFQLEDLARALTELRS